MPSTISSRLRSKLRAIAGTKNRGAKVQAFDRGLIQVRFRDEASIPLEPLISASMSGMLSDAAAQVTAEALAEYTKQEANRFRHSGALASSITATQLGRGHYIVDSDSDYKATWTHSGDQGSPPIDNIYDWMRNKRSFRGGSRFGRFRSRKTAKESGVTRKEVAFLISRAIREQRPDATGGSTLRALNPSGERFYDYPRRAMEIAEPDMNTIGAAFEEVI